MPPFFLVVVAFAIATACGVGFSVIKSRQYATRGQIEEIQLRMKEHEVSVTLHQADIDGMLGYYRLIDHMDEIGSPLVPIESLEVYQEAGDGSQETMARR